jgi:hypothetical protein
MRNAGDRTPGGSAGPRQRPSGQQGPPRSGGNGSPSLFTPAYRVSHAATGSQPVTSGSSAPDDGQGDGYGRAGSGQSTSGYGWADADADQSMIDYQRSGREGSHGTAGWPGDQDAGRLWPDNGQGESDPVWAAAGRAGTAQAAPQVSNAVRGFPPAPGDSLPVYPPGPFAAWNRSQTRASDRGRADRSDRDDTGTQLAAATITPDEFDTDYSLPAIRDPLPSRPGSARPGAARPGSDRPGSDRSGSHRPGSDSAGSSRPGSDGRPPGRTDRPGSAGPSRPAGSRSAARRSAARASGKHQHWLAIGAAAAIIVVGAGILVALSSNGGSPGKAPKAGGTPTPVQSSAHAPAGPWKYIGSRTTDPLALTTAEMYPASFTNGPTVYTRARTNKSHNCHAALIGSSLETAVHAGGCNQALRATYVSHSAGVMATIGVFNLKTAALASAAATKAGHYNFVAQLQSKTGPAHSIGKGTGIEEALVKGHYLVLVWAEATDLHAPKGSAQRARLESFMNLVISKTVNVGLSYRMVDGQPTPTPSGT